LRRRGASSVLIDAVISGRAHKRADAASRATGPDEDRPRAERSRAAADVTFIRTIGEGYLAWGPARARCTLISAWAGHTTRASRTRPRRAPNHPGGLPTSRSKGTTRQRARLSSLPRFCSHARSKDSQKHLQAVRLLQDRLLPGPLHPLAEELQGRGGPPPLAVDAGHGLAVDRHALEVLPAGQAGDRREVKSIQSPPPGRTPGSSSFWCAGCIDKLNPATGSSPASSPRGSRRGSAPPWRSRAGC